MVQEAEKMAGKDKEERDRVDLRNSSDSMVYQTRKQLEELGDKVPGETKTKIEAKVAELEKAVNEEDYDKMKKEQEELQKLVMEMGSSMYQGQAPPPGGAAPGGEGAPGAGPSPAGDGDVIDADFSEE